MWWLKLECHILICSFQKKSLTASVEKLEKENQSMKEQTALLVEGLGDPEQQNITAGNVGEFAHQ